MKPAVEFEGVSVFHGDCRDVLKTLPDNSVDSVVTDPPYELGFMGKKWDSSGIAYDVSVWAECLRVLKPGGHVLAFGGSRTFHRLAVAVEDAGFEIRDTIAWISSKTFPKSLNVSKAIDKTLGAQREVVGVRSVPDQRGGRINSQDTILSGGVKKRDVPVTESATPEAKKWEGWGTGLKQVVEPVVLGRKPLDGTVAHNTLTWGVGGLNIDATRIDNLSEKEKNWTPQRQHADNPMKIGGAKPGDTVSMYKPGGRWPANVILDEVSAGLLDEQSGVSKSQIGNRGDVNLGHFAGYAENQRGVRDNSSSIRGHSDSGGASRFFYVAKASKRDRNEGLEELEDGRVGAFNGNVLQADGNKIGANPDRPNLPGKNTHPTVKPTQLMRYLIKLVTPPGGVVLDPFTGSGSTGKAAILDGFQFVGVELTEEYLPIIEGRLQWAFDNRDDGALF